MFWLKNNISFFETLPKVNYEDVQYVIKNKKKSLLINILKEDEQDLLILNTLDWKKEEETINYYLKKNKQIKIVIYGKNAHDSKLISKYDQLNNLGFKNTYVYLGGLYEWVLLQEIYGYEQFPTNVKQKCVDLLKYKPSSILMDID